MGTRISKILFIAVLLLSVAALVQNFKMLPFELPDYYFVIYYIFVIISSFIWILTIVSLSNRLAAAPKQVIIQKVTEKKEKKQEKKQAKQEQTDPLLDKKNYNKADSIESLLYLVGEQLAVVQGVVFEKVMLKEVKTDDGGKTYYDQEGVDFEEAFIDVAKYAFVELGHRDNYKPVKIKNRGSNVIRAIVFYPGEGLVGQVALDKRIIYIQNIPEDYFAVKSALGQKSPRFLAVFPVEIDGDVKFVFELASFKSMGENVEARLEKLSKLLADVIKEKKLYEE